MRNFPAKQSGVMLLEALIGILIFSIGILAMVGLQALSIKNQADAKYRADASYLANQIIGQMWADSRANLASYVLNPTATFSCPPSNPGPSAIPLSPNVTNWTAKVQATLPGAVPGNQQIIYNALDNSVVPPRTNQVLVVVCWKAPQETTFHNYLATTYVN